MLYIYSNIISFLLLIFLLICSLFVNWRIFKKIKTKDICLISVLIALSTILTNIIGYSFTISKINFSLALGQWILFIIGVFYGPLYGVVAAICEDLLGDIINVGGIFHFGFMLSSCLCAIFGSFVYYSKKPNKFLNFKISVYYSLYYILKVFLINPILYYSIGYYDFIFVNFVINVIKTPLLLFIYLSLVISTNKFLYKTLLSETFWIVENKKKSAIIADIIND